MEFWGEEVKPGKTVSCEPGDGFVIHFSQAALGETKKGSENVVISVKVGDKKLVIGTLSADKHPQIASDLIFDKDFEISHNSKTTTVFICGYKSVLPDLWESDSGEEEDDELLLETENIPKITNGTATEKSAAKVPAIVSKEDAESDDSETSSGTDDFSDDSDSEDESLSDSDDISSGTDDFSDSEEEEETPKPEVGKKRAAEASVKTPASDKKAKVATPSGQKTVDKKSVHVATPHPAKQASKTPADGKSKEKVPKTPADGKSKEKAPKTPADGKSKEKSPKSAGSHSCKSCNKTFNSGGALESHQKAKNHAA